MSSAIVIFVFCAILVALALLGRWQRAVDSLQNELHMAKAYEAGQYGYDKPIAQHPLIDTQACIGCGSCIRACPEEGVLALVDGVVRIIEGSQCIGHGRCAEVCPVNAIEIGLGENERSPDRPALSPELESSKAGIYVAGELGGLALIRVAVNQGVQAINKIAEELASASFPQEENTVDVLIVGSGPAGFAASLEAKRLGIHYLTIDQQDLGGTIRKYPRRKLTLTGKLVLPGIGEIKKTEFLKEELLQLFEQIANRYQLQIRSGLKLISVSGESGDFVAQCSGGIVKARKILLALGRGGSPKKLNVQGEGSERVLYQLIDAASYQAKKLLVVGGGDSAIEAAIALASQSNNQVYLSYRKDHFFRLKQKNSDGLNRLVKDGKIELVLSSQVQEFDGLNVKLFIQTDEKEEVLNLQVDYSFVLIGGEPPKKLLNSMGVLFEDETSFHDLEAII